MALPAPLAVLTTASSTDLFQQISTTTYIGLVCLSAAAAADDDDDDDGTMSRLKTAQNYMLMMSN